MGFAVSLILGAVMAGVMIYGMRRNQPKQDDMKPQGLDSFGMTKNSEGQVVPRVFGRVRLSTTLWWYGNLKSKKVKEKAGGKGGSQSVVVGYEYWLDLWHGICQGPGITLEKAYVQDKETEINELPVDSYEFNPGSTNVYPTVPGEYTSPMIPLAHIYLDRYSLGLNTTNVPTIHLVVTYSSLAPLTHANESNGTNPAAVIYDLLRDADVPVTAINTASFEDACTYWHGKGYGLNLVLDRQTELKDHINSILSYVDATLRDDGSQFYLIAHKDTDVAAETITTEEFKDFNFARRSWDDVYTDFRANFISEEDDFSQRTVRVRNSAARSLIGHDNQFTVDLAGFRDVTTASARLWDLMKRLSYPEAEIKCTVPMRYVKCNVGDVLGITHSDYGLSGALYRIRRKEEGSLDSNDLKLELTQVLQPLVNHGDAGLSSGKTHWKQPHLKPAPPVHQRVLELPYTSLYGENPAYICLCERSSVEDEFIIRKTVTSGSDYTTYDISTSFSQYGTLAEAYTADTYTIDDEVGIRYTPSREDPVFDTIARATLFSSGRIAVLYNQSTHAFEIVTFQTVTPVGETDMILSGVIRGLMNTAKSTWPVGTEIWLTSPDDNVITDISDGQFYLKFVPMLRGVSADEGDCDEMTVNYKGRARTPWPPSLVRVSRSGINVTVTVWPTTRLHAGAGVTDGAGTIHGSEFGQTDQWPPEFTGSFNYSVDDWATVLNADSYMWEYDLAGAHTLRVRALSSGYQSLEVVVAVGAGDGDYYGPED